MASDNVVKVTPGKGYTLTGKAGAAVQCVRDGKVYVPASLTKEGQVGFTAPCAEVEVVGDGFVTENFRSAALALGSGGGDGGGGVSEDAVASIVGSTFKLAVGSEVPKGSADTGSIALGGVAEKKGLAIGYGAHAREKSDTIALGYQAKAYGDCAVSIGGGSSCRGSDSVSLGGFSEADYGFSVALGDSAKCFHSNCTSVGFFAQSYNGGGVAVGYLSKSGGDSIAIGSHARIDGCDHAIVIGANAETAHPYTVVIGEKSRSIDECSVLLEARKMSSYAVLRMELLAGDMECTGGDGGIGDADAFVTGGALRFTAVDKVAGTQETMTIALEQLWAMLEAAGGLKEKGGEAYYY